MFSIQVHLVLASAEPEYISKPKKSIAERRKLRDVTKLEGEYRDCDVTPTVSLVYHYTPLKVNPVIKRNVKCHNKSEELLGYPKRYRKMCYPLDKSKHYVFLTYKHNYSTSSFDIQEKLFLKS